MKDPWKVENRGSKPLSPLVQKGASASAMEVCVTGAASVALVCLIHTRPQPRRRSSLPTVLTYILTFIDNTYGTLLVALVPATSTRSRVRRFGALGQRTLLDRS
jgi:hypothetical protein